MNTAHRGAICARCDDDGAMRCSCCGGDCDRDPTCTGCTECWPDDDDDDDWDYDRFEYNCVGEPDEILAPLIEALRACPPTWPPLPWVVQWSEDGRDPLVAAWNATRNIDDMRWLCGLLDYTEEPPESRDGVILQHYGFIGRGMWYLYAGRRLVLMEDAIKRERPRWLHHWERIRDAVEAPRLADVMEAAQRIADSG